MNHNRAIIIVSLLILSWFSFIIIGVVKDAFRETAIESYSAERIVLLRTCRAKWPLGMERYQECVRKVIE